MLTFLALPVFVTLLGRSAVAAPLPSRSVTYTRPASAGPDDLSATTLTMWPVGAALWAVSGEVAVLDAPGGVRTGVLDFGEPVIVEDVGNLTRRSAEDARIGVWYRVGGAKPGWVFGSDLTDWRWTADVDGDGEKELVTVAWNGNFTIRVRVFEPAVREGGTTWMDVGVPGGNCVTQPGGALSAELLPAGTAGLPLVHLALAVDACGNFRDEWVSYTSPGPQKIGGEHLALSLGGMQRADASSTYTVKFSAGRKTASVTRKTVAAAGATPDVLKDKYILRDAAFVAADDATAPQ